MKILKTYIFITLFTFSFAQLEYSLKDQNSTSPTFNDFVWLPTYSDFITVHFFSTQGWGGWTSLFGQLSDLQEELRSEGFTELVFISVGQSSLQDMFGESYCANSDLPLVLDQSPDFPIREQFNSEHRQLIFIDRDGRDIGRITLTSTNLSSYENQIRSIIEENYEDLTLGDINQDGLINIQDIVVMIGAVLNNIELEENQLTLADLNQDGALDILDIVATVNLILG